MQRFPSTAVAPLVVTFGLFMLFAEHVQAASAGMAMGKQPTTKPSATFAVLKIDLGDKAWGLNLMKVQVRNKAGQERRLFVHIGGRFSASGRVFGMGEVYTIAAGDQWIEHWYYIPPGHGTVSIRVKFTEPVSEDDAFNETPFLVNDDEQRFAIPNRLCNNLTITEKLPVFTKFYGDVRHLESLKPFGSDKLVLYCSPDTPAFEDAQSILKKRESALKELCMFAGATPTRKIAVFLFPDQPTKRMCTGHTGDGLARGNETFEVYSDEVKLDVYHELAHIVMAEVGAPPALLNEGFATYMQAGHRWKDKPVDQTARELLSAGKLVPLADLIARGEIGSRENDGEVAYPEAAAFVKFLIEIHGKEKFLAAYKSLKNGAPDNAKVLREIYGKSLEQLEAEWQEKLTQAG